MWTKTITPRFGEIDGQCHVNNCVPPTWFETARDPFFRLFHPKLDLGEEWNIVMAKYTVEFSSQMVLGADVEIRTFIKRIGRSSVTVYHEAWQNGVFCAKGDAVLVYYDLPNRKSIPIPERIREELQKHFVDENNPNLRSRSGRISR